MKQKLLKHFLFNIWMISNFFFLLFFDAVYLNIVYDFVILKQENAMLYLLERSSSMFSIEKSAYNVLGVSTIPQKRLCQLKWKILHKIVVSNARHWGDSLCIRQIMNEIERVIVFWGFWRLTPLSLQILKCKKWHK